MTSLPKPPRMHLPSFAHQPFPDADDVLLGLLDAALSTSAQMSKVSRALSQVRHEFEDAAHLMFDDAHTGDLSADPESL